MQGADGRLDVELAHRGITLSASETSSSLDTVFVPRLRGELRSVFADGVRRVIRRVRDGATPLVSVRDAIAAARSRRRSQI